MIVSGGFRRWLGHRGPSTNWPCWHPDLGSWASKTVNHPVCGNLFQQFKSTKTILYKKYTTCPRTLHIRQTVWKPRIGGRQAEWTGTVNQEWQENKTNQEKKACMDRWKQYVMKWDMYINKFSILEVHLNKTNSKNTYLYT